MMPPIMLFLLPTVGEFGFHTFFSSSYVNWIDWMNNYVYVVGLDRIAW